MKTLSAVAFACVLGSSLICRSEKISFEMVQPVARNQVMKITGIKRGALKKAISLHNLMVDVHALDQMRTQLLTSMRTHQLQEARLIALEKCSVAKLSEQFKDPEAVWDRMKQAYAQKEKDLSIYVNSAEPATDEQLQAFENYMQTGQMTEDMVAELLAPWRIGQEILMDVYQNQDAWGERKDGKSASFPLWEDQKYQFDKDWDNYYTKLNTYFGAPQQGRPNIGDEKYDYAKAEDVTKAHEEYVAMLAAKAPRKAATLPPELKKMPTPPRPLPPKNEILVYLDAENPEQQFYPAMPEPWQKYKDGEFKDVNPKGEMAQDFMQGMNLKTSAKYAGNQSNRLVAYSALSQTVDSTGYVEDLAFENAEGRLNQLRAQIAHYINIEPNADLINPDVQAEILKRLKVEHEKLVAAAEEEMQNRNEEEEDTHTLSMPQLEEIEDLAELKEVNPEAFKQLQASMPVSIFEQDKNMLAALKADPEGTVYLNEVNAGEVDKMLRETTALEAFIAEQDGIEKGLALSASVPIDDTCLNGGI